MDDMRIYCAGSPGPVAAETALTAAGLLRAKLVTYADSGQVKRGLSWAAGGTTDRALFLDSGAFSVHTRGTAIDLGAYCEFVAEHKGLLSCYASLDVIGDSVATEANLRVMRQRGLTPVPTFHMGSPWPALEKMASECSHIALGGMLSQSTQTSRPPADRRSSIQRTSAWSSRA